MERSLQDRFSNFADAFQKLSDSTSKQPISEVDLEARLKKITQEDIKSKVERISDEVTEVFTSDECASASLPMIEYLAEFVPYLLAEELYDEALLNRAMGFTEAMVTDLLNLYIPEYGYPEFLYSEGEIVVARIGEHSLSEIITSEVPVIFIRKNPAKYLKYARFRRRHPSVKSSMVTLYRGFLREVARKDKNCRVIVIIDKVSIE